MPTTPVPDLGFPGEVEMMPEGYGREIPVPGWRQHIQIYGWNYIGLKTEGYNLFLPNGFRKSFTKGNELELVAIIQAFLEHPIHDFPANLRR